MEHAKVSRVRSYPPAGGLEAPPEATTLGRTSDLLAAWGSFIGDLAPWQWFVTLTFRPAHPCSVLPASKASWLAWREFDRFCGWSRQPLHNVHWAAALEWQRWRGVPHIHALVGGLDSDRYSEVSAKAWEAFGFNRILSYDPELGASHYIAKYVTKELGDIRFSDNIRAR